jgi:MinD superfamily P-loop ATPase
VVEPTLSGEHDLSRILATTNHFGVAAEVIINKADINPTRCDEIRSFCASQSVNVLGLVPYDTVITEAMVAGQPVTEYDRGPATQALQAIWRQLRAHGYEDEP